MYLLLRRQLLRVLQNHSHSMVVGHDGQNYRVIVGFLRDVGARACARNSTKSLSGVDPEKAPRLGTLADRLADKKAAQSPVRLHRRVSSPYYAYKEGPFPAYYRSSRYTI